MFTVELRFFIKQNKVLLDSFCLHLLLHMYHTLKTQFNLTKIKVTSCLSRCFSKCTNEQTGVHKNNLL